MKPIVATCGSPRHPGLHLLRDSCQRTGWEMVEIGDPWRGFMQRMRDILALAPGLAANGFTHLVHVDAYDVVALGHPEELEACLAEYGNPPMLVAVEAGCWPDGDRSARYEPRTAHWWYPHSQYVLDLQQPAPVGLGISGQGCDQRHLHDLVIAKTPGIVLDRKCLVHQSIAFCCPWQAWFEIEGARIRNTVTGSLPLFAHGNGRTDLGWLPGGS